MSDVRMPGDRFAAVTGAIFPSQRSARNVFWNLLGGVVAGVAVVVATPIYVSHLGLEGYGIVGLWLVVQVMMGMLDVGMGATVVKEFASAGPGDQGDEFRRNLLRTLEYFYWGVAATLGLILLLFAEWLGRHWLKADALSSVTIGHALQLMAIALALQFPMALYSSGLAGLQEHGRMNALQIAATALRYGGGVLVVLWRSDVTWFFAMQGVVAAVQTLATRQVLRAMITSRVSPRAVIRLDLVRQMWRYSAGMGVSALGAVLLANADRIALSALRPTAELGKYSIAFTATGLLQLGIQPFHRAFFPRYSELVTTGSADLVRDEYFRSCQLIAGLLIPLGILGWTFAPQLLHSWLGRSDQTVTQVFRWLLIGITCSGLMWLPAAFQQAHGWTRLHAGMIGGALLVGAPLMVWAIRTLGTVGATTVWVVHGLSGITIELWLMHRRLLVGQLAEWYRLVVVPPLLVAVPVAFVSHWSMPPDLGRWASLGWVAMTTVVAVASVFALRVARIDRQLRLNYAETVKE